MKGINKFQIDFTDTITPFFQVSPELRIRFGVELFEEHGKHHILKQLLNQTLNQSENMDMTFISGYMINGRRYREKTNIGKYIKINNWSETVVYQHDIEANVIFASIQNVRFEEVYRYIKSMIKGFCSSYLVIYNENYLVYVSQDVLDIITYDQHFIHNLKSQYQGMYDTYYET